MVWSANSLETHPSKPSATLWKKVNDDGKQFTSIIILGKAVKAAAESILPFKITILKKTVDKRLKNRWVCHVQIYVAVIIVISLHSSVVWSVFIMFLLFIGSEFLINTYLLSYVLLIS